MEEIKRLEEEKRRVEEETRRIEEEMRLKVFYPDYFFFSSHISFYVPKK